MKGDIEINNGQDFIDSRDVINRIDFLQYEVDDLDEALKEALAMLDEAPEDEERREKEDRTRAEMQAWEEEWGDELTALKILQKEARGYCDWENGETLIRDSYFADYAEELARDIGAITSGDKWPVTHIDWDAAAEELKQDYTSVDFDGEEYWIRCN